MDVKQSSIVQGYTIQSSVTRVQTTERTVVDIETDTPIGFFPHDALVWVDVFNSGNWDFRGGDFILFLNTPFGERTNKGYENCVSGFSRRRMASLSPMDYSEIFTGRAFTIMDKGDLKEYIKIESCTEIPPNDPLGNYGVYPNTKLVTLKYKLLNNLEVVELMGKKEALHE